MVTCITFLFKLYGSLHFFQIPAFPVNCHPHQHKVKLTSSFHSFQTLISNTTLFWALLWMTVQAQTIFWAEQVFPFKHISWDWECLPSLEMAVSSHWGRRKLSFMLQKGKLLLDCHQGESPLKPNKSFMNESKSKLMKYMVTPKWGDALLLLKTEHHLE